MYPSLCFVDDAQLWHVILVLETDPLNFTPRYSTETAGALYHTKQGAA
jgi:hypothetical protein